MRKFIVFFLILVSILCVCQEVFLQGIDEQQIQKVEPFEEAERNSKSSDPYIRRQAAEQFGMLRDPRAVPYLKNLLKDENPFVRQTAVDSLGLLRSKESLDEILNIISIDKEPQVRQSAIVAVGYIGVSEPAVVKKLVSVLEDEKELPQIKYAACNTLSIIRSTEAVPVLVKILSTTDDINLKKSSVFTLGKIAHPEGIAALRESVDKNLQNENLLVDIIRVLVEVSDNLSIEKFKLIYSTNVTSQNVKFYAAYGLAKIAKDKNVLPVINNALKSQQETIKNMAIEAARFIGDKDTLVLLKEINKKETSAYTKQLLNMSIKQLEVKYPTTTQQKKGQ
ncbi:MAG: HEAT repeat domain-containing protein [Endomicrobia bacterium]|nr:HEAT repeat domain-containing protein [Endomicrobiia bacterium]